MNHDKRVGGTGFAEEQGQSVRLIRPIRFGRPIRLAKLDQRGVASLIITMVTMVVISLIVIGFATISRREQRQSLDQQLSTQAFYAAESGVEDAKNVIKSLLVADPNQKIPAKPDCTSDPSGKYPTQAKTHVDEAYDVSYTCLTVDPSPTSLQFNGVSDNSIVVPVSTDLPITTIRLTWTPTSPPPMASTNCPNSVDHTLKQQPNWNCGYGMLRADMTPTDPANGALSRPSLVNGSITGFFEPTTATSTGSVNYNARGVNPNLISARCATSGPYGTCQATIDNIAGGVTSLSLRLSSLYQPSNLKIEALNGSTPQKINGVQATIDSTGKAGDVLRRIQVRLPVVSNGLLPGYALQSNSSICKHFASSSDYFEISGVIDPDPGNAMCNPMTDGAIPVCIAYNDVEFVLDQSGSMNEKWQTTTKINKLKELTNLFIQNAAIAVDKNHAGIVSFSSNANNIIGLSYNVPALVGAVNSIGPNGNTNYGTGLTAAAQELAGPNSRTNAKKIIIFMSDGQPTDSVAATTALANNLKSSGVEIYTIGIANNLGNGRQVLTDMSGNGGWFGDANNEADLDAILKSITLDLACQ
jgi:uncharacterized protein YegL/Tfp pilus assembly protein PilV